MEDAWTAALGDLVPVEGDDDGEQVVLSGMEAAAEVEEPVGPDVEMAPELAVAAWAPPDRPQLI